MAFPVGWPPRPATARRSLRFFQAGTATANFDTNAYLFSDQATAVTVQPLPFVKPGSTDPVHVGGTFDPGGAVVSGGSPTGGGQASEDVAPRNHDDQPNTQEAVPHPMMWSNTLLVRNTGGTNPLELSFDGVTIHGRIAPNTEREYKSRYEAGIAVRSAGGTTFEIEAW